MPSARRRSRYLYRTPKEHFSASGSIPRWVTIPFILIIGIILWVGVLSDSSGRSAIPDTNSVLYVAAVIAVAVLVAYADRKRNKPAKIRDRDNHRDRDKDRDKDRGKDKPRDATVR